MEIENEDQFEVKGPDAHAFGKVVQNGFLVFAGGAARKEIATSGFKSVSVVHKRLIDDGVLVEKDGELKFTRDHVFESPSGAAAAVLGRTANGWIEWKKPDGSTLSMVKRVSRDETMPLLSMSKREQIRELYKKQVDGGNVPTKQELEKDYLKFRERFHPTVLARLDGEALLDYMHDHSNKDSLVFWLEWKNDDEFVTRRFGSIAGGSALKFRIFRRKETGNWQKADKSNYPTDISIEEAIEIARLHRDQIVSGVQILEQLPENASDNEYAELQDQMDEAAPDVSRLAWGHKYFSLLFPNKIDDYHNSELQHFHLLKLLQLPPDGDGRYVCAGRFVAAAKEVNMPINHFTSLLNLVHGNLHRYWRIGTTDGAGKSYWSMMQKGNRIAIGWADLKDLSWVAADAESRKTLKEIYSKAYPKIATVIGKDCTQLTNFVAVLSEGDIVLAADGMKVLGVGKVVGPYEYHSESDFAHQRGVDWMDTNEWQMPVATDGLRSTVRELKKAENILAIEQRIAEQTEAKPIVPSIRQTRLTGISGRIQSVIERKGQVILYGPPGTGKTFWAERTAFDLASISSYGVLYDSLDDIQKAEVAGQEDAAGLVRMCCFHSAYGYEDFLEGFRPGTINNQMSFECRDGVFKKLCNDAAKAPDKNFYLIVDEINRGDIPRIFGELLTTIEKDKRGKKIILPISQSLFSVPRNVHLIGTMNTADRSISLLDAALRRRFGFVELMPDGTVFKDISVNGITLQAWFDALNQRIRGKVGRDSRNLQIGHSYLMQGGSPLKDIASLKRAIRDDIIPLLEEYCYEDYTTLGSILGDQLVDVDRQRVRHELFDEGKEDILVQALLSPFADISTSSEAIATDESIAKMKIEEGEES